MDPATVAEEKVEDTPPAAEEAVKVGENGDSAPATEDPDPEKEKAKHAVFMGNLSFTVTKQKVTDFYKEKGLTVLNLRIPTDKVSGEPKGFAFVEFDSAEDLATAVTFNGSDMAGRPVKIEKAQEPRPKNQPTEQKTREPWSETSSFELRFAVPAPFVRKIIGKKGETIKRLSKESGARAMFGERLPESWTLGNDLQHLSIKGTAVEIQTCVASIVGEMIDFEKENGRVDEMSKAPEGHVPLTMLIPLDKIPMIIGQKGARIKEIEKLSKTSVDVQEDQVYSEKYVTFTGEKEEVGNAVVIAAKGLPVGTWDPERPSVTPKTREKGKGGGRGGRGPPPRGMGRYDDYGPPSPRYRGPPPRDYDDRYGRGPPRGPPRGYYDDYDRGPPLKRGRAGSYDRGPPPRGYGRAPPPRGGDDFW